MLLTNTGNLIVSSRKSGAIVSSFIDQEKLSIEDGYSIQNLIVNDATEPFGKLIGWKMGATNEQAMKGLNLKTPFYGPLFDTHCLSSSSRISLKSLSAFKACEAEFLFIMKNDLVKKDNGDDYTEDEVFDSVEYICPAIEIASSRFTNLTPGLIIADCALNAVFLYDHKISKDDIKDYKSLENAITTIEINDQEVVRNFGTNVLGNPVTSLTFLVNALNRDGLYLKKGDVVLSGACSAYKTLQGGDKLVVKFNQLIDRELDVTLFIDE